MNFISQLTYLKLFIYFEIPTIELDIHIHFDVKHYERFNFETFPALHLLNYHRNYNETFIKTFNCHKMIRVATYARGVFQKFVDLMIIISLSC